MKLAFSIPVHENNDTVEDLLRNVRKYNPGCVIVLHASQIFKDFDEERFAKLPGVHVNPERHMTAFSCGLLNVHCSNFRHLCQVEPDFDTFCLISSNEMFIRPGLEDYVAKVKNAFQAVPFNYQEDWHVFYHHVDRNPHVLLMTRSLGMNTVYGGQTEGQFFEKRVFDLIAQMYAAAFGAKEMNEFETEEIVPSTMAMALHLRPAEPFTLVDYTHESRLNLHTVALLADPERVGKVRLNLGRKLPQMLVSPHLERFNDSVYSVKRVERKMDDPLRQFINHLGEPIVDPKDAPGFVEPEMDFRERSAPNATCLVVPVYPPHFEYARALAFQTLEAKVDLCLVFTSKADRAAFLATTSKGAKPWFRHYCLDDYYAPFTLETLQLRRIFPVFKKFFALDRLRDRYKWFICPDAETHLLRNEGWDECCERLFASKVWYGGRVPENNGLQQGVAKKTATELVGDEIEKATIRVMTDNHSFFSWWWELPVYKAEHVGEFLSWIGWNGPEPFQDRLSWFTFDHCLYEYYTALHHNFRLQFVPEVEGSIETADAATIRLVAEKYRCPTWINCAACVDDPDFATQHPVMALYHLDRKK